MLPKHTSPGNHSPAGMRDRMSSDRRQLQKKGGVAIITKAEAGVATEGRGSDWGGGSVDICPSKGLFIPSSSLLQRLLVLWRVVRTVPFKEKKYFITRRLGCGFADSSSFLPPVVASRMLFAVTATNPKKKPTPPPFRIDVAYRTPPASPGAQAADIVASVAVTHLRRRDHHDTAGRGGPMGSG